MRLALTFGLCLMAIGNALAGDAKGPKIEVIVDGTNSPTYQHKGKTYTEALKGKEYAIRISNPSAERVAVALSVDGLNTIDAKQTKARDASKWIVDPYQTIVISGWQVSDQQARQFYFTTEEQSYGAKLGKTANLGVISAAFFKERRRNPISFGIPGISSMGGMGAGAGSRGGGMGGMGGGGFGGPGMGGMGGGSMGGMGGGGFGGMSGGMGGVGSTPGAPKAAAPSSGSIVQPVPDARADKTTPKASEPEYAATGMGKREDHAVERQYLNLEDKPFKTINLRYEFRPVLVKLGVLPKPDTRDPLVRREGATGFIEKGK
jgi:hypothetical protein